MKKAIYHFCLLFFLSLLLLFSIIDISAQITFQKTFGGLNNDNAHCIQQTTGGGYIIAGYTESFGVGSQDVYLIRTDGTGNLLWSKTFGGSMNDFTRYVQQTTDKGFILVGSTFSFGAGGEDIYVIKTDSLGNLQWSNTFGGGNNDRGFIVQQTTDGGFIIGADTWSYGSGQDDIYLIKTDSTGNMQWSKVYGASGEEGYTSLRQTNDNGYIILSKTTSFGAGSLDYYLLKVDSVGNFQWNRTYGGTGGEYLRSIDLTNDGGYIIAGHSNSYGVGSYDLYVVKTDSIGNLQWSKTYGGSNQERGYSVRQTTDGGFAFHGWTNSFGIGSRDIYVIKTDSVGNLQWAKAYGGTNSDYNPSISTFQQTNDNGYVITGGTSSFGFGNYDVYLIKTDVSGNSGCNEMNFTPTITTPNPLVTSPTPIILSGGPINTPATILNTPATLDSLLCINCTVSLTLSGNTSICNGDSATLNASGGISYLWSTGDTTPSITVSPLVTTTYLVTVSDSACFAIDSVTISILASFDDTVYVTICIGDSIFAGGSYQSASGTYYDTLAANNGCDSMITTNLSVVSEFITNINSAICEGDSLFIAGDYQTTAGTYYDTTLSAGGCDSIIISTLSIIQQVAVTLNSAICTGDSIFAGGGYQSSSGTYYDSLFTVNGCDSIVILNLSVYPGTSANAERDTTIKRGEIVQLFGSGGLNYSWSPSDWLSCTDCPDPIASPLITTTYCVTVSDINGCTDEDCITIIVEELICDDPFVPNVFSPNGDNNNDIVYVRGNNFIIEKFIIYDRWGEKVFETTNINQGWDGAFRGKTLNPAVFVYYLETTCTGRDDIRIKKGNITLVR